mmetsp:Transcript_144772/g.361019  ORF Transcript_144772/g.361019 Transcript_144772/m.361019 type:complete len:309 (-) Transcript_144772:1293-2219(-)
MTSFQCRGVPAAASSKSGTSPSGGSLASNSAISFSSCSRFRSCSSHHLASSSFLFFFSSSLSGGLASSCCAGTSSSAGPKTSSSVVCMTASPPVAGTAAAAASVGAASAAVAAGCADSGSADSGNAGAGPGTFRGRAMPCIAVSSPGSSWWGLVSTSVASMVWKATSADGTKVPCVAEYSSQLPSSACIARPGVSPSFARIKRSFGFPSGIRSQRGLSRQQPVVFSRYMKCSASSFQYVLAPATSSRWGLRSYMPSKLGSWKPWTHNVAYSRPKPMVISTGFHPPSTNSIHSLGPEQKAMLRQCSIGD